MFQLMGNHNQTYGENKNKQKILTIVSYDWDLES
jgi:hypothetical protein